MSWNKLTRIALRLSPEIEKRLEDLARKTGRTKSFYAREAITEHVADLKDAYLAESRLGDDAEFVDYEDVVRDFGINLDEPAAKSR